MSHGSQKDVATIILVDNGGMKNQRRKDRRNKHFLILLRVSEQEQDNIQLGRSSFQLVNYSNPPTISVHPAQWWHSCGSCGSSTEAGPLQSREAPLALVSVLSSPSPRTSNKWRHCDMVSAKLLIFSIFIATCLAQYEGKVYIDKP